LQSRASELENAMHLTPDPSTERDTPAKDPEIRKAPLEEPPRREPPREDPPGPAGPDRPTKIEDPRVPGEPDRVGTAGGAGDAYRLP
jgi:hypothetical protein